MTKIKITTKSSDEIMTAFTAVFKERKPRSVKTRTQADRLAPYRKAVMQQRRRGFEWDEIAAGMADPRIGEKVSPKTLKEVFDPKPKPAAAGPANPPSRRVILDPATGQPRYVSDASPATPPAPAPVPPMTPKEHAAWDETLKQLITTIVNTGLRRNDARQYANLAAERMKPAEFTRFQAIVENELETLTDATCATYGLTPESFATWHRKWVRS